MNSCRGLAHCFFITIVLGIIQSAISKKYEGLYFIESLGDYEFVYNITKNRVAKAPDNDIMIACPPRDGNTEFFEVVKIKRFHAVILPLCKKPIESRIFKSHKDGKDGDELKSIGFLIQKPKVYLLDESSEEITDDSVEKNVKEKRYQSPEKLPLLQPEPEDESRLENSSDDKSDSHKESEIEEANQNEDDEYKLLELIVFKFDETYRRIKFVWHSIAPGKLLKLKIDYKDNQPYQTNRDFYPYDVDFLYSQSSGTYVKVQLAPEEDFLFKYWKSASRQNILTAPMRHDLLPQWQQLEIFIRKVTQVIDEVFVMTGIHGTLTQTDIESQQQTEYLHNGQYAIPGLFWKAVAIDFKYNGVRYRNGIIFVMHNVDPHSGLIVEKICPADDLSQTGWLFPADLEFKHLMYACLWDSKTMQEFEEDRYGDNPALDLNRVPTVRIDDEGKKIFEVVDVIEKMNNGILDTIVSYFINAIYYPFTLFSSYYYDTSKNK